MRDKFKSRLVVMHGRLYILVPELVRDAMLKSMGCSLHQATQMPCEVEVEL